MPSPYTKKTDKVMSEETKQKISKALKGIRRSKSTREKVRKARLGVKRPEISGVNHYLWKGDDASYSAIHIWIKNELGPPSKCEHCGLDKIPKGKKRGFHWANKTGNYLRNTQDWLSLCVSCHKFYDLNRAR